MRIWLPVMLLADVAALQLPPQFWWLFIMIIVISIPLWITWNPLGRKDT